MIRDRRVALVFRAVSLLFAITGLSAMMGFFSGEFWPGILAYYTMQSNILAIILFAILTIKTIGGLREDAKGNTGYFARFEMVCTINVMLTFIVYWVLLAPTLFTMVEEYSLWTFDNLAVHAITPLLCLADYILFTAPRHLKYRDIYCVCIFPLLYMAGTSIAGLLGYVYFISPNDGLPVRFPYFFYDFDRIGAASLIYIGAIVVFFLIVGHVFYLFDKRIRKTRD
jgi:hypothetical protein